MNINLSEGSTLQNGKYKIIRTLGKGGFGITYLARHVLLDKIFAVKDFFPQDYCTRDSDTSHVTASTTSNGELVDKLKARFFSEARNVAELRHANIIGIHDETGSTVGDGNTDKSEMPVGKNIYQCS